MTTEESRLERSDFPLPQLNAFTHYFFGSQRSFDEVQQAPDLATPEAAEFAEILKNKNIKITVPEFLGMMQVFLLKVEISPAELELCFNQNKPNSEAETRQKSTQFIRSALRYHKDHPNRDEPCTDIEIQAFHTNSNFRTACLAFLKVFAHLCHERAQRQEQTQRSNDLAVRTATSLAVRDLTSSLEVGEIKNREARIFDFINFLSDKWPYVACFHTNQKELIPKDELSYCERLYQSIIFICERYPTFDKNKLNSSWLSAENIFTNITAGERVLDKDKMDLLKFFCNQYFAIFCQKRSEVNLSDSSFKDVECPNAILNVLYVPAAPVVEPSGEQAPRFEESFKRLWGLFTELRSRIHLKPRALQEYRLSDLGSGDASVKKLIRNIWVLADHYNVSEEDLYTLNGIKQDIIHGLIDRDAKEITQNDTRMKIAASFAQQDIYIDYNRQKETSTFLEQIRSACDTLADGLFDEAHEMYKRAKEEKKPSVLSPEKDADLERDSFRLIAGNTEQPGKIEVNVQDIIFDFIFEHEGGLSLQINNISQDSVTITLPLWVLDPKNIPMHGVGVENRKAGEQKEFIKEKNNTVGKPLDNKDYEQIDRQVAERRNFWIKPIIIEKESSHMWTYYTVTESSFSENVRRTKDSNQKITIKLPRDFLFTPETAQKLLDEIIVRPYERKRGMWERIRSTEISDIRNFGKKVYDELVGIIKTMREKRKKK